MCISVWYGGLCGDYIIAPDVEVFAGLVVTPGSGLEEDFGRLRGFCLWCCDRCKEFVEFRFAPGVGGCSIDVPRLAEDLSLIHI